jgi:hypothetical protein
MRHKPSGRRISGIHVGPIESRYALSSGGCGHSAHSARCPFRAAEKLQQWIIVRPLCAQILAVLVLLVAGSDYWAFDMPNPTADMPNPTAPMDAAASVFSTNRHSATLIHAPQLPDDCCLFCGSLVLSVAEGSPLLNR